MKNIVIALGGGLVAFFLLTAIGVSGFLMTVIIPFIPVLIYTKLTTYKTKPFIIAWVVGIIASFLSYFVLQIISVMFGFGDAVTLKMAYISAFIGFLVSVLTYRQLNDKSKEGK